MCAKTAQSGKKRGQAPAVCDILKKYKIVTKWAGARHVPAYVEVYGYGSHSEPYGVGHHRGTGAAGAAGGLTAVVMPFFNCSKVFLLRSTFCSSCAICSSVILGVIFAITSPATT